VLRLFAAAIFLSAALLFLVQPMTGKVLLPLLGGSPAVWNTCMVFFQGILLLGYLYAHLVGTYLRPRYQPFLHAAFVLIAAAYLLFTPEVGEPGDAPTRWLIQTLLALVGLPFLAVSTTGPLLQRWFSRTDHPAAKDPYFLYAASNAGSLLGLLAYPTLLETTLTRDEQRNLWTIGFWLLVPLIVACGVVLARRERAEGTSASESSTPRPSELKPITPARRARWVILAAVPSSLMLGVTQHISTDIAAIPLLWIGPLIIYLLSFIVAFSPRLALTGRLWGRIMPFTIIAALLAFLSAAQHPILLLVALHLCVFLVAAMMCHTLLAEDRPAPTHLTSFYLCMSLGGVVGGSLNALVAPMVFNSILEYPLIIGAACLLRPQLWDELAQLSTRGRVIAGSVSVIVAIVIAIIILNVDAAATSGVLTSTAIARLGASVGIGNETLINIFRAGVPTLAIAIMLLGRGSLRFALAATLALAVSTTIGAGGVVLYTARTFFGVNEVVTTRTGSYNQLTHGTTLHGLQFRTDRELPPGSPHPDADFRYRLLFGRGNAALPLEERRKYLHLIPTTYYYPTGPIGDVMRELTDSDRFDTVALIGLGTGSLLAYARPNSTMHVYEIDPAVVQIAREPALFRYIYDAQRDPTVRVASTPEPGDGRLDIAKNEDAFYRLIVIDAFTSDAVPIHLITSEAVETYLRVLKQDGMIAFHVSSRYFDLVPVLGALAKAHNLQIRVGNDARDPTPQEQIEAKKQSTWVVLARTPEALGSLARNSLWENRVHRASDPLWTDDFANPMGVFRGWWLPVQ
jgi:SAM-dependent methyltransferase